MKGQTRWQVSFYDGDHSEIAQVLIDDATGTVTEAWTGPQVAWTMARGYPGAFGRKASAAYVWIPLLILFVVPFVDWRHPLRMRHLDLLALCSLSVSLAFFNHGNLAWSVPTEYPPLLYLLGRLLWIGLRRRDLTPTRGYLLGGGPGRSWLAIATIFLVGFRIGLNVTDSNVIDVGYSGVIGADKISHGTDLYGGWPKDNEHGDTYGPVNYLVYVPFEQIWPWHGTWDDLPAAHGAAVVFDLLCLGGLFLLGRRLRGPTLGVVLAYAWAAFPFTLFSLATNSNDGLVAAFLIGVMLVATSAPARGVFAALAGFTKFAPLLLAPLLATHGTAGRPLAREGALDRVVLPRLRRHGGDRAAAGVAAGRLPHRLGQHAGLPARSRRALLGVGLLRRPGRPAACGPGGDRDLRDRGGLHPAAPRRDRPGGDRRRDPAEPAAGDDLLVLPVHRVGDPVRLRGDLRP